MLFTIIKSQSHTCLNFEKSFPVSQINKPPSKLSVTFIMVVHNIVQIKEGENASANMTQETGNIKNYKKKANPRGKNN